jgi:hypothetical protein
MKLMKEELNENIKNYYKKDIIKLYDIYITKFTIFVRSSRTSH